MDMFTEGQAERMSDGWLAFRAGGAADRRRQLIPSWMPPTDLVGGIRRPRLRSRSNNFGPEPFADPAA